MKNGLKRLGFILIIIAGVLIIVGIVLSINASNKGKKISQGTEKEENFDFVVENKYKEHSMDQQIALILVSDYIRDQAVIENLEEVSYSDNEFRAEYITRKGESEYTSDKVTITTRDFVSYNLYCEYNDSEIPRTTSLSGYEGFLYTTRNMVYDLAKNNNYVVGETLDDNTMMTILDILKQTDAGSYIKIVEDKGYKLRKYSAIPKEKITFIYEKADGSYLEVYSAINNSKIWVVYGSDIKKLSDKYKYVELISGYVVDETIHLEDSSYNKLKAEIGTFLDD